MSRALQWSVALLLGLTSPVLAAPGAEEGWFPFVLPSDDDSPTVTSVADLNATPAGSAGFLRPRGGTLVDGKGNRVRLLGVNLVFDANFPDKEDAKKVAARLRKFGVNVVRLHHMDYFHAPRGIFDPRFKDTQHLDRDQLDRLDHLVWQLKRNGIYTNVNLHVSRHFSDADGFKDADRLPDLGKVVTYFEPRMIELQKKYARDLLGRTNPYTRTRYADEPAVAVIELTNENTLVGAAWDGGLEGLPASYREELRKQWNAWLKAKYTSTAGLAKAWRGKAEAVPTHFRNGDFTDGVKGWNLETHQGAKAGLKVADGPAPVGKGKVLRVQVNEGGKEPWHVQLVQAGLDLADGNPYTLSFSARADRPRTLDVSSTLDVSDWHNVGLTRRMKLGKEWQSFNLIFTAARTKKDHNRIVFALGQAPGSVELAGVSLRQGPEGMLPEGASLEAGTIPPGQPVNALPGWDWIAFLIDTERRYVTTMRDWLKKDLGVKSCVVCSQASYGGLAGLVRENLADFTDMHAYWDHPRFPRKPWDSADWLIRNTPMAQDKGAGTIASLARHRLAGRPFTVSEYNHPAPGDYQAECVPFLAAFACWQDWDGIYFFDYNGDRKDFKCDRIRNFFSIDTNPAKMALLPAAALLFRRGDLAPAPAEVRLDVPAGSVPELMARYGPGTGGAWEAAGSARADVERARLAVKLAEGKGAVRIERREGVRKGAGALRWEGAGTDRALLLVDSPSSKMVVGFAGGRTVDLEGWSLTLPAKGPKFATLALTALDGLPAVESRSLLLTALGRVQNVGMGWNAERTSVGREWGKGPVQAEGIPATVTLKTAASKVSVHALDGTGRRQGRVAVKVEGGQAIFRVGPEHRTLWYEIQAEE